MAPTDMPTACPDVRLVDSFEPSSAGTSGTAVAVTCAGVDVDDVGASKCVVDAVSETVPVATIALADAVLVIIYETGCAGSVIVPERVFGAADFSPEQMLYRAWLSSFDTVVHSALEHEYANSPIVNPPRELCCEHKHERSSASQENPEVL